MYASFRAQQRTSFRANRETSFRAQRGISLFFVFFFIANITFAQTDPLTKKVTSLVAYKEPIENVLTSITQQTSVRFSYNSQIIDPKTKVSVNAQNKTVKEILTIILPPYISYKKVGEHIVFVEKGEKEKGEKENTLNPYFQKAPLVGEKEKGKKEKITFSNNGNLQESCLDSVSLTKNDEMKALFTELLIATAMAVTPALAQDTLEVKSEELRVKSYELQVISDELQVTSDELQVIENLITSVEEKDSIVVDNVPAPLVVKPFLFTFFYPLGTGWVKSPCNNYHVSLSILGGVTGQTIGIDLGGLFNINTSAAKGVQFAGLFNVTGSRCSDVQSRNAQFAGVFNITKKGKSAQFGGVFNIGDTAWVQASGLFNIANSAWMQFSGFFNIGKTAYLQAGGIFNRAEKSACQIAGILNITKKGKFQMGLINVRDTADGVSLGLINIVKKGGVLEAGIEAGEFVHTALTFRSGVKRLYSIISVGYNYTEKFWSVGAGLGTSFKLIGNLGLNLELSHSQLYLYLSDTQSLSPQRWNTFCQFKPLLNYRFAKHFKIYVGPSFNLLIQNGDWVQAVIPAYEKPIKVPYSTYSHTSYNTILDMWIGVTGGIKF